MSEQSPPTAPVRREPRLSLLIQLKDEPGALEQVLSVFSGNKVNLTHIESRPRRGETFDFYVDCEGSRADARVEGSADRSAVSASAALRSDCAELVANAVLDRTRTARGGCACRAGLRCPGTELASLPRCLDARRPVFRCVLRSLDGAPRLRSLALHCAEAAQPLEELC